MDINKIVSELVGKLNGKNDLISSFLADPAKAIKDLLGIDIDPTQIAGIVKGVQEKLGTDLGDVVKQGKGILDTVKSIFGK